MAHYIKNGNIFRVAPDAALDLHAVLPGGTFVIKRSMEMGFFLEQIDNFELPSKLYGSNPNQAKRILDTFHSRSGTTGVMLVGEKGSGKSLLAKTVSINAAKEGIPTIVVNQPWTGDEFNQFLQLISQQCIILLDEFEKTYDSDKQQELLTLLDGIFSSRKLFLFTSNNKYGIDRHMQNRPGRIFYLLEFRGLDPDFIREYCEDNLKNKSHITRVVSIANAFYEFNFDMLKALVEEMNRYDEDPKQAMQWLNIKAEYSADIQYDVAIAVNGIPITEEMKDKDILSCRPFMSDFKVHYKTKTTIDEDGDEVNEWQCIDLSPSNLYHLDHETGDIVFKKDQNVVVLRKHIAPAQKGVWTGF